MADTNFSEESARVELVRQYFEKVGARDESIVDLFSDDVEMHFPKFGVRRGKSGIVEFEERMGRGLAEIGHHIDDFKYIVAGNTIVVEGTEYGKMHNGKTWPDGNISNGRFCIVFEFDGPLIKRMYIYVDPDFTSDDMDRVRWLVAGGEAHGQAPSR